MKVFTVEFTMFSGVEWNDVDYKITAQTFEELETAVLNELQWMSDSRTTVVDKWDTIKNYVIETDLVFPIIEKSTWS